VIHSVRTIEMKNSAGTAVRVRSFSSWADPSRVPADVAGEASKLSLSVKSIDSADPTVLAFRVVIGESSPQGAPHYGAGRVSVSLVVQGAGDLLPGAIWRPTFIGGELIETTGPNAEDNHLDFSVTRPAVGAPTGGVTIVATADGAVSTSAHIEVPPLEALSVSSQISFNNDWSTPIRLTGTSNVKSIKVGVDDTGEVDAATVRAGAATNGSILGGVLAAPSAGSTRFGLAFGYTELDGGGRESPPCRFLITRPA
jgi:hypothetical protein